MSLQAGIARTQITPFWGVELAGWGYYLNRTWKQVRDHLASTALVLDDGKTTVAIVAVDMLYADADFVQRVRKEVWATTKLSPKSICVTFSHSHNAPTAALIRGAGEMEEQYLNWAVKQIATSVAQAWQQRKPCRFYVGQTRLDGWTFNRTRDLGPVDTTMGVWRIDHVDGEPMACVVNYQAHPTVMMGLGPEDVSRDFPGQVTDTLETAVPGLTSMFIQGACGDINFLPKWNTPSRCHEPGRAVASAALYAGYGPAKRMELTSVSFATQEVVLPTRRWEPEEISHDRDEAEYRLKSRSTEGWRENLGRVMVNNPDRFPERYGGNVEKAVEALARFGVEWTDAALRDLDQRPETLTTEIQAIRVGEAWLITNPSELFTSIALEVRRQWPHEQLLIATYANDSIGYLPDAHDVEAKTYAAYQAPKYKNQFPFVAESADVMVQGMLDVLARLEQS